jgi:PiT family inorganic phosphate transporter
MPHPSAPLVTALVIVAAIAFDFVNGFHDAANSIATIVATRILKPVQAVMWAAFFNFAAVFVFGSGVAHLVGSGLIALDTVTPEVILAGLLGAIAWGLITWWFGLPTSSSHALLGGYAGASIAHNVGLKGWSSAFDSLIASGWGPTVLFIALAPVLGLALAQIFMKLTLRLARKTNSDENKRRFGRLQMLSSAFLSLMHGSNDAQKTAGIISSALVAGGYASHFDVPNWVLWSSYATMALGTLAGGWRIVNTMGRRLTRLNPASGFCAESAAALSILLATLLHLPVSTTHTTTGAIVGVGAARRVTAVRWSVAERIVCAWLFTIPAAGAIGAAAQLMLAIIP